MKKKISNAGLLFDHYLADIYKSKCTAIMSSTTQKLKDGGMVVWPWRTYSNVRFKHRRPKLSEGMANKNITICMRILIKSLRSLII